MKIISAVDGSEQSLLIVHCLAAFAPIEHLILLHALQVPQLAYPGTGMGVGHEFSMQAEQTLRKEGSRILKEVVSQLPEDSGPIEQRLERGSPAEVILSVAEQEKTDLNVMGSRGLGVIQEHVLGSVSHRVVTHAPCSTFIVKDRLTSVQNILLPIANKIDAERLISFLSTHPFRGPIQVTLLHVIPFAQPVLPVGALIPENSRKDLVDGGNQFTKEIASQLSSLGYATSTIVKAGTPSIVIHEEAQKLKANLIVMGDQNRGKMSRFLLGSVSHSMIHHGICSVLLLR